MAGTEPKLERGPEVAVTRGRFLTPDSAEKPLRRAISPSLALSKTRVEPRVEGFFSRIDF
jgi:hypothetical protein